MEQSVELHLFFLRIMKEHALFMEAAFQGKDSSFIKTADNYKADFENLILEVIKIGDRAVGREILESEEIVTPYTLKAEEKTQNLTGIAINKNITLSEGKLSGGRVCQEKVFRGRIQKLNRRVIELLNGFIGFKEKVLEDVENCEISSIILPLLADHVLREANHYLRLLEE